VCDGIGRPQRWEQTVTKGMNRMEACFEALQSMDLTKYEGKWLLLIGEECVFADDSEQRVLEYATSRYPAEVPCLVRVPSPEPVAV